MIERLQKILARAGVASRRAAEVMILEGRVTVNGQVVRVLGTKADHDDDIRVDGRPIGRPEKRQYRMLNKPPGVVTTLEDPQGRPTVGDLIAGLSERLYPVGRLDYDSEGLLLLTNDGTFAYGIQHPRFAVPKTYRVKVAGHVTPTAFAALGEGLRLEDGLFRPLEVTMERRTTGSTWLTLVISEGRNRVIRRAMTSLGFPVRRLIRTAIGGVEMGDLDVGLHRPLTASELETLRIFIKKFP
jgi:23S rRNA pseudouridine2605 synthase